jgi:phosphoribosylformimino-5-aminoimidazole carboxamide ribotide isomerase
MIAYAAVDVRGGRAVQLVGGVPGSERISLDDPSAVAEHWIAQGFRALHIVDLDAALGSGDNRAIVDRIITAAGVPVQVGGGIRTEQAVAAWLNAGAARVIVGTRAVEDPDWLRTTAAAWPGRLLVAADVRGDTVVTRGWTSASGVAIEAFLGSLAPLPLAGVLVTDVAREGRLEGINATRFAELVAASPHPLIAAGGIAGLDDLRALERAGAAGAVLGMALYTAAVDARAVAQEFNT